MNNNKVKIFNRVLYIFCVIFATFQVCKIFHYATHRTLDLIDYRELLFVVEHFVIYTIWFVFATLYCNKQKFRTFNIISYSFCSIMSALLIYTKAKSFRNLFFQDSWGMPSIVDKITSLTELILAVVIAVLFVSNLIYLFVKKYFKKSS